jgi:thiol-disulfide isomerase/thioredoxin
MSRQYDESLGDTFGKIYAPLLKFLSVLGLIAVVFVGINLFTNVSGFDEGYEFNDFIVRDYNMFVGPEEADVVLVHLYDLQCPVCASYDPVMNTLKEEYADRVKIVYKHNPIEQIHPQAEQAARAVQAASLQDTDIAFQYSSALLARQSEGLSSSDLRDEAEVFDLDIEQWQDDRTSFEVRRMVDWDLRDIRNSNWPESANGRGGKAVGELAGTPANVIFVNGEVDVFLAGSEPLESMRGYLDAALAR